MYICKRFLAERGGNWGGGEVDWGIKEREGFIDHFG